MMRCGNGMVQDEKKSLNKDSASHHIQCVESILILLGFKDGGTFDRLCDFALDMIAEHEAPTAR